MTTPTLTLIEGGAGEAERLFDRLLAEPQSFSQDDYEDLSTRRFADRLSRDEWYELGLIRIERTIRATSGSVRAEFQILHALLTDDRAARDRAARELLRLRMTVVRRDEIPDD